FVRESAGMPWINLSALLDVMVHWGLPSRLVCRSVGAEDFYRVGFRPFRAIRKLPVFLQLLRQQSGVARRIETWIHRLTGRFDWRRRHRELLWESDPAAAFREWETDFRQLYVELVANMQALTGAMSGPIGLFDRLGLLAKLSATLKQKSASADYLLAFQELQYGMISRQEFLSRFGHRGFYESDIGQKRFFEYSEAEWQQLIGDYSFPGPAESRRQPGANALWMALFRPVARLIHTREWLRNETMKLFWDFRRELLGQTDFPFQEHSPGELLAYFNGGIREKTAPKPSGWDMDTFLCNRNGRRLPLSVLSNVEEQDGSQQGIGIYPGLVEGQVWRVSSARFETLEMPEFEKIILVADALDPGWAPFFSQVDGVISYVGGLLSHASILLRESHIPAITQLPPHIELKTGDWVEMDGQTGEVRVVSSRQSAVNSGQ
nr:PEP-utilizing enzyme [Saprospiraceae bacterium]